MVVTIILSILAAAAAVLLWAFLPLRRGQLAFGALFSLPIVVLELVAAGSFHRLGVTTAQAIVYLVTTTLLVVTLGGVIAVLADMTINRWFSPAAHERRHTLAWLLIGCTASLLLIASHHAIGFSLILGLMVNAFVLVALDRDLIWDAIVGASAFGLWFVLADVLFGIRAAGDIHLFLIGATPIGVTLGGLPAERVLVMLMAGLLLGPLFAATKHRRNTLLPKTTSASRAKVMAGLFITIVGVLGMAWWSMNYVLPPTCTAMTPTNGSGVDASSAAMSFTFSRPVNRDTLTMTISPVVDGTWEFLQPTMSDHGYRTARFVLTDPLTAGTTYHVVVSGISSVWGLVSPDITLSFSTAAAPVVIIPPVAAPVVPVSPTPTPVVTPSPVVVAVVQKTMLPIAVDYQDSPLSCEAAALKMALAGRGIKVTENQIMNIVGYDPTPHRGSIWGDPSIAFVGNIAGKQDSTGYGVYWGPIAKAASHWGTARVLSNGTPEMLAAAIAAGHPVVVWGTLGNAYRDDWKTPAGKSIVAWKGEHARTLIGFVGPVTRPTSFILNDPVVGRISWTRAQLDANWARFNRSAVIIE